MEIFTVLNFPELRIRKILIVSSFRAINSEVFRWINHLESLTQYYKQDEKFSSYWTPSYGEFCKITVVCLSVCSSVSSAFFSGIGSIKFQSNFRILENVISQDTREWWILFLACRNTSKFLVSCVSVDKFAQSIQKTMFAYLCNISRKTWAMNLLFCLKINTNVFYKLIGFLWLCKSCTYYPKRQVYNISPISQGKREE